MSTVIVTGSRDWNGYKTLSCHLDTVHALTPITLLVEGGARGADDLAALWANKNGIQVKTYPADWQAHGKAAGPIRNREMLLAHRDALVIAFPIGRSPGTRNCMSQAEKLGMKVINYGL